MRSTALSVALLALSTSAWCATYQKTGSRGGTASATTTQKGNKLSGTATATGAHGKTATANGTATVKSGSVSAQGHVTGPSGGSATGSATATSGSLNASGSATGKNGKTASGTVSAAPGSATVTSGLGRQQDLQRVEEAAAVLSLAARRAPRVSCRALLTAVPRRS